MSLDSRRELADAAALRYLSASKSHKGHILDEFIENTGFNRKYAIGVLRQAALLPYSGRRSGPPVRIRARKYGPDVSLAFVFLWRLSGGVCPKRLVPFLPDFIEALERFDEFDACPDVKLKLLTMSISTAERILSRALRSLGRGISTTRAGTLLRQQIPIRTYEDWTEAKPGFLEIDLVAHCGGTASGDYLYTLTMTDICTGWTECVALPNRSQAAVETGIERVRRRLPFPILGIDTDNGSEFINHNLKRYCDKHSITFTRCRPYKKNDQCHVEQKNGAHVRCLVGYARYEGAAAADHLNRLYAVYRLSVNFFQPSMKLVGKSRAGARVKKTYDDPLTPWQRLQRAPQCSDKAKTQRTAQYLTLNPAKLRRDIQELEVGLRRFTIESDTADLASLSSVSDQSGPGNRNVTIEGADANARPA